MQDINLSLRETLKTYMNSEVCGQFKERWIWHRKAADLAHNIQTEDSVLDKVFFCCLI